MHAVIVQEYSSLALLQHPVSQPLPLPPPHTTPCSAKWDPTPLSATVEAWWRTPQGCTDGGGGADVSPCIPSTCGAARVSQLLSVVWTRKLSRLIIAWSPQHQDNLLAYFASRAIALNCAVAGRYVIRADGVRGCRPIFCCGAAADGQWKCGRFAKLRKWFVPQVWDVGDVRTARQASVAMRRKGYACPDGYC